MFDAIFVAAINSRGFLLLFGADLAFCGGLGFMGDLIRFLFVEEGF